MTDLFFDKDGTIARFGEDEVTKAENVIKMLNSGKTPTAIDLEKALNIFALDSPVEPVRQLLEAGATIHHKTITYATMKPRNPEVFRLFLKHGWDPNSFDRDSPAINLVLSDDECVQVLLQHGANANIRGDFGGFSALQLAVIRGRFNIVNMMIAAGTEKDPRALLLAVGRRVKGGPPMIKCLIDHGFDVNAYIHGSFRGMQGTPLLWAIHCRNRPAVELLLEAGADLFITYDGTRVNVLVAARKLGHAGIYGLLEMYRCRHGW